MINLETFFINHFDSDRISDNNMDLFTQDHIERIKANNPANIYDEIITATEKAYNDYYAAKTSESFLLAQKEAATVNVEKYATEFIRLVSMKEGIVRGTWGIASPQYQEFYPHGITEYSKATRSQMNSLMDRFLQTATKHAGELPPNFVEAFTDIINNYKTHRTAQLGKMGTVSGEKQATAQSRDVLEIQLMYNVLFVAKENIGHPEAMKVYFTQHMIERSGKATEGEIIPVEALTGTVPQNGYLELMHGGFDANSEFRFTNTGQSVLRFYTSNLPDDPVPGTYLEVPAGEEATAFASELGSEENLFLMVFNPDTELEGAYEVLIKKQKVFFHSWN